MLQNLLNIQSVKVYKLEVNFLNRRLHYKTTFTFRLNTKFHQDSLTKEQTTAFEISKNNGASYVPEAPYSFLLLNKLLLYYVNLKMTCEIL